VKTLAAIDGLKAVLIWAGLTVTYLVALVCGYYLGEARGRRRGRVALRDIPHGTRNAYTKRRCRCADCCAANTEYAYRYRQARKLKAEALEESE
jgi:hypothetical protein